MLEQNKPSEYSNSVPSTNENERERETKRKTEIERERGGQTGEKERKGERVEALEEGQMALYVQMNGRVLSLSHTQTHTDTHTDTHKHTHKTLWSVCARALTQEERLSPVDLHSRPVAAVLTDKRHTQTHTPRQVSQSGLCLFFPTEKQHSTIDVFLISLFLICCSCLHQTWRSVLSAQFSRLV